MSCFQFSLRQIGHKNPLRLTPHQQTRHNFTLRLLFGNDWILWHYQSNFSFSVQSRAVLYSLFGPDLEQLRKLAGFPSAKKLFLDRYLCTRNKAFPYRRGMLSMVILPLMLTSEGDLRETMEMAWEEMLGEMRSSRKPTIVTVFIAMTLLPATFAFTLSSLKV